MATQTMIAPPSPSAQIRSWRHLEERPHPWRRQLYVKDRRLLASSVWSDMIANRLTAKEIAQSRDLPVEAVLECIRYCEENRSLLQDECTQEEQWLRTRGARPEPPPAD